MTDEERTYILYARSVYKKLCASRHLVIQRGESIKDGRDLFKKYRDHIDRVWHWLQNHPTEDTDLLLIDYAQAAVRLGMYYLNLKRDFIPKLLVAFEAAQRQQEYRHEANIAGNLGIAYAMLGDDTQALLYYEHQLKIGESIADRSIELRAKTNIGICYKNQGNLDKAIELYKEQLELARYLEETEMEILILNNLGITHTILQKYDEAIQFHTLQLDLAERLQHLYYQSMALNNFGAVYRDMQQINKARSSFEQALSIKRLIGDKLGELVSLIGIAEVTIYDGDGITALVISNQAEDICEEMQETRKKREIYGVRAQAYQSLGKLNEAIRYYELALKSLSESPDMHSAAIYKWNLGLILYQRQREKGLQLMQEAVEIYNSLRNPKVEEYQRQLKRYIDS